MREPSRLAGLCRSVLLAACAVLVLQALCGSAAACTGDCNDDGTVAVDELLDAVGIALGTVAQNSCPAFATPVTVDLLLAAVNNAQQECSVNQAPAVPCVDVYHAYSGHGIGLPIGATDPEGGGLLFSAASLPAGAQIDAHTGVLSWTPLAQQAGPWYIPVTVTDNGIPAAATQRLLTFAVAPPDACSVPSCNPTTGCTTTQPALRSVCCAGPLNVRVGQPLATCPYGQAVFLGRNVNGFGRLQDCDYLQVVHFQQQSALVLFNVQVRCLNTAMPVAIQIRLETRVRLLFDSQQMLTLQPRANGYAQILGLQFSVTSSGPFHDIDSAPEANLSVTATDLDGNAVTERLRVVLTFDLLNELPEAIDVPPPAATCPASMLPMVTVSQLHRE